MNDWLAFRTFLIALGCNFVEPGSRGSCGSSKRNPEPGRQEVRYKEPVEGPAIASTECRPTGSPFAPRGRRTHVLCQHR